MSVPRLYWIGMPIVKNPVYNKSLRIIDSVHESLAEEYSSDLLKRISLKNTIPGKGNSYMESMHTESGSLVQIMSEDGNHFTVEGGQLVMHPLFESLKHDYLFSDIPVPILLD